MSINYLRRLFNPQTVVAGECDITKVKETVELLKRTSAEQRDFATWQNTAACQAWRTQIRSAYHDYEAKCKMAKCCGHIDFSQKRCAKNFVISNDDTAHNAHDFRFLLDYFRDQLLALGYCVQVSDCRTYHCSPTKQETIERHYLKPIAKRLPSGKLPQLFGNITLTLHCKNGEPAYLKCCAAHFRDVNLFEPVLPMSALIDCLTA